MVGLTMTDNTNTSDDSTNTGNTGGELVRMDWHRYEQPALGVIEAIAGLKDRRPTDLPPLGNEFDVDALNSLLTTKTEGSRMTISFEYQELVVTISQSGSLVVQASANQ